MENQDALKEFLSTLTPDEYDRLYTVELVDSWGEKLVCYDYATFDEEDNNSDSKLYPRFINLPEVGNMIELKEFETDNQYTVKMIMTDKEHKLVRVMLYDLVETMFNKRKVKDEDM